MYSVENPLEMLHRSSNSECHCQATHIQQILLNYSVEDDGDEEIEEDRGAVLPSVMVQRHLPLYKHWTHCECVCVGRLQL